MKKYTQYTPRARVGDFYWVDSHPYLKIARVENDTYWCTADDFSRKVAIRFGSRSPINQPENVDIWLTHTQLDGQPPGTGSGLTRNRITGSEVRFIVYNLNTPHPDADSQDDGHRFWRRDPDNRTKSYRQEAIEKYFENWEPILEGIPYTLKLNADLSAFSICYDVCCVRSGTVVGQLIEDLLNPGWYYEIREGDRSATSTHGLIGAANQFWGYWEVAA